MLLTRKTDYALVALAGLARQADTATEDYYLYIAQHGTVGHVENLVRKHAYAEKLQTAGFEESQYESRQASYYRDDDGCWVIKAKLPPAEGELLVNAINALSEQEQESEPNTDAPRLSFAQKRADALCAVAEHYLATAEDGVLARWAFGGLVVGRSSSEGRLSGRRGYSGHRLR